MAFMKFLLPALAITSLAAAATGDCDGKVIENQSDADGLRSCTSITGDIEISKKVAGTLTLNGVQKIEGKLTCTGAENLTDFSAPSLSKIGKDFILTGLTSLSSLTMEKLEEVDTLQFSALPRLQLFTFTKGISKAKKISITNTDLQTAAGIDLETVGDMEFTNNFFLQTVNVNKITNATGLINFAANSMSLKISFPNLQDAQNMTFRNASEISIPSLKKTKGLLGVYSCGIESFSAPNLTTTGDFVIVDNSNLKNISLPQLTKVSGALQIANNTELKSIDQIPKVKSITGALDVTGSFDKLDLPELTEVLGQVNVQTSGDLSCDQLDKNLKKTGRGKYICSGKVAQPKDRNSPSSPTKSGVANPLYVPAGGMTYLALLGAVIRAIL